MNKKRNEIRWSVAVDLNGKNLVRFSFNEMSGLTEFAPDEEEAIRLAGENLLAFIGERKTEG